MRGLITSFTQPKYNMKYIKQLRLLKLGKLLDLQATHPRLQKIGFLWKLSLFQSPQPDANICGDFELEKHSTRP